MATRRSYRDACGVARALDVVGERWALLVVRELLFGPRRFTDLRRALPAATASALSDRLGELLERGIVDRRTLPPPAASGVYELSELGRGLEPIVVGLGSWGTRFPRPDGAGLSASSVLLYLRTAFGPDPENAPGRFRFHLNDGVWTIDSNAGNIEVRVGEPDTSRLVDATLQATPETLNVLLQRPVDLDAAIDRGTAVVSGDTAALRQLFTVRGG